MPPPRASGASLHPSALGLLLIRRSTRSTCVCGAAGKRFAFWRATGAGLCPSGRGEVACRTAGQRFTRRQCFRRGLAVFALRTAAGLIWSGRCLLRLGGQGNQGNACQCEDAGVEANARCGHGSTPDGMLPTSGSGCTVRWQCGGNMDGAVKTPVRMYAAGRRGQFKCRV